MKNTGSGWVENIGFTIESHPNLLYIYSVVLRHKAPSQAKPAVKKPGQAGPFSQLEMAFGLAQGFTKPEPGALAEAFCLIF